MDRDPHELTNHNPLFFSVPSVRSAILSAPREENQDGGGHQGQTSRLGDVGAGGEAHPEVIAQSNEVIEIGDIVRIEVPFGPAGAGQIEGIGQTDEVVKVDQLVQISVP